MDSQLARSTRSMPSPAELAHVLSTPLSDGRRQCKLCSAIPKASSNGGQSNFAAHLRTKKHVNEYIDAYYDLLSEMCEKAAEQKSSDYINLQWIPGTSNEVERLFSRAGLVLSERRQRMYPSTLEKLLMLEYNDHLWDAYTVAEALRKAAALRREEARKRQRMAE